MSYTNDEKTDRILFYGNIKKMLWVLQRYFFKDIRIEVIQYLKLLENQKQHYAKIAQPKVKRHRERNAILVQIIRLRCLKQSQKIPIYIVQILPATQTGISQSTVGRIRHANNFRPYHITLVQVLKPIDFPKRVQFCHFIQRKLNAYPNFLDQVLFSDETRFSNNGEVNRYNYHYHAQKSTMDSRNTFPTCTLSLSQRLVRYYKLSCHWVLHF